MEPPDTGHISRLILPLNRAPVYQRSILYRMKNTNRAALVAATAVAGMMVAASASPALAQCGRASWYALHSKTASGERMNPSAMTAAHRSLPFGTKIKVTNKNNGKSVVVRINDRGPFIRGRVLDLSRGAARELGFVKKGQTSVCMARL